MRNRRIVCILLIVSALILYIFDNESVTLALLLALVVMPAVSVGVLALSGRHLDISMEREQQSGDNPVVKVKIHNPDLIPVAGVETEIVCTNLRTGEADSYVIRSNPGPKSTKEFLLEIIPKHAGRYEAAVANVRLTDPLQLAGKKAACSDREYVTVMPEIFDMQISYASDAAMLEGDRTAANRRGNDPGEVREIREYVPGDPVRNIHWKLSEKMDKLMVKELGNPITDRFLIIFDTAHEVSQDPAALEAIASVFASLAETVRRDSTSLSIGWTDPETGRAVIRKINTEEELTAAADDYLAVPAAMHSAFSRIERDIAESRYAHIIVVGSMIPEGLDAIANGCQVTVLLYGENGSVNENNVIITGFGAKTCKSDLAGIEV